jgi:TRAP-type C4-dicarboxylate transport system permease small subunit
VTYLTRFVHSLSYWAAWVAAFALPAMMLLTCSDVILRYLGHPILGSFEIMRFLGAAVAGLAIAYTQILRGHISIEFIVSRFPPRTQAVIDSIIHLFSLSVFAVLAWQCSAHGTRLWELGQVSDTLQMPYFPFLYLVAFGCAMMSLVLLLDFISSSARLVRK